MLNSANYGQQRTSLTRSLDSIAEEDTDSFGQESDAQQLYRHPNSTVRVDETELETEDSVFEKSGEDEEGNEEQ